MEEGSTEVLSVSELVRRSRPLTGGSSVLPSRSISSSEPSNEPKKPSGPTNPKNPNSKILKSLNHPTILVGTLTLPSHNNNSTSNSTLHCSNTSCFSFSDGTATVCCDLIDHHPRIIGKVMHVLAWNFIPFKCGGGFLEIIRWSVLESSCGPEAFALFSGSCTDCKDIPKSHYYTHGSLQSVSPLSVVPCTIQGTCSGSNSGGSRNICGFLVNILVCECKLCHSKDSERVLKDLREQKNNSHCFEKPVIVYFCGSASSWHPVISKLIGCVVLVSGLKKKLIYMEKGESQLMYVTTEKALLHLSKFPNQRLPIPKTVIKGRGEVGGYVGTVTGIYMHGMVVELDQEVMLLLTDPQLTVPHSVRVGAIVSVRNVHFVNPRFSWTKILILGACMKTSMYVQSFSPMETGCHIGSQLQSLLGKFIDSVVFSARLWVLLVISCFRKKFAGILSEKEILGSKHPVVPSFTVSYYAELMWTVARCYQKEGLAQKFARSHLPLSNFHVRHGVFMEYCKHDSCGCGNELSYGHLKLAVPISNFISHCETSWTKLLLEWETDLDLIGDDNLYCPISCEGRTYGPSIRRILHGENNVVLLGKLEISPSSGRLQLIDATGSIDVVIPDLSSSWNINSIYEVNDFTVVMEGIPEKVNHLGSTLKESFSCRNIFNSVHLVRVIKLTSYLYYHLRDQSSRSFPFYPYMDGKGNFEELKSGRFHVLWITHKFPVLQKFQGDQVISNRSSIHAEARILPWDLFLAEKDRDACPSKLSAGHSRQPAEGYASIYYEECVAHKRCKIDRASGGALSCGLRETRNGSWCRMNCCSSACKICQEELKCCDLRSPCELPCFVTCRDVNGPSPIGSGILHCTKTNLKVNSGCNLNGLKVLLEFHPESFCKYELLRIGGYYLIKPHKEDPLCASEDFNAVSGGRIVITSRTNLWSLSFSSDEVFPSVDPSHVSSFHSSFVSSKEFLSEGSHRNDSPLLRFNSGCPEICSDISLSLSSDVLSLVEIDLKSLEEGLIKPSVSLEGVDNISRGIGSMMTTSVQSSGTYDAYCHLPEGNLISLHGHVLAVHNLEHSSPASHLSQKSPSDVQRPNFFQRLTSSICIHVLVDLHVVKILGDLSLHPYPIGFGPGVNATFHRILVLGQKELMLTPASFIVLNSIQTVNDRYILECNNSSAASGLHTAYTLDTVPAALISEILHSLEHKAVQFHCRVVAVYVL
ncbi:unnamed protein product, partial [Ilex paraguariensis]